MLPPRTIAVGAIVAFTTLNYFGVKRSSRVNLAMVIVSLGALILFVIAGAGTFRVENLRPFAPAGVRGTLEAAALLFFAYTGYARIATLAEEVREPRRVIPKAIVLTIAGAVLLYAGVAIVAVGAVGADAIASSAAPLHVAALAFPNPKVGALVSIGGVTAMLGVILRSSSASHAWRSRWRVAATCRAPWRPFIPVTTSPDARCSSSEPWPPSWPPQARYGWWRPRPRSRFLSTTASQIWPHSGCRVTRSCMATRCPLWGSSRARLWRCPSGCQW